MSNKSLSVTTSYQLQVNNTFESHNEFVDKIKSYAHNIGFTIKLGKFKYLKESKNKSNSLEKSFQKRILLCSRAGFAKSKECNSNDKIPKKEQNRQIINMDLTHNYLKVKENYRFFMSIERNIPNDVKQRIELLRRAGVNVLTIRAILKEEFGDHITWIYDDIYNFIYHLEGSGLEKKELDAEEFVKILDQFKYDNAEFFYYVDINENTKKLEQAIWMFPEQCINYSRFNDIVVYDNTYKTNHFKILFGIFTRIFTKFLEMVNQHAPVVILTDDDHTIANAYSKVLQLLGTKHHLCQWHLMKNIMKNLSAKLNTNWSAFIRDFYKCLEEMDNILKTSYPLAVTYLSYMEKTKEKWAACFNCDTFMADIMTIQCEESMNNMMKGYLDANTSLTIFITAFQLALNTQSEKTEFRIYQQNNFNTIYKTTRKGRSSNKRITSTIELASNKKKNSKKDINAARSQDSNNLDNYQSNDFGYNMESSNEIQNSNIIGISSDSNSLVQCFVKTNFSSNEINLEKNQNKDMQCQYCGETLPNPLPLKVSEYLNDIATKKKLAQTAVKQYKFCQVYRGEGIIIPYGIEKGYLLHIDFTILPDRVRSLKYKLLKIIKGQQFSEYRVDAVKRIQEIGASKANSSLLQINYFELFQYYGTKGLAVILETLTEIFVQTKILTTNLCVPQSSFQYLAQVLVPKTAIRLIAENFNNISLDAAKKIIIDSIEFGLY
ncbi:30193_t:CDS:2, partial [Gigaspora margarita]